jgi:hypothetical protein
MDGWMDGLMIIRSCYLKKYGWMDGWMDGATGGVTRQVQYFFDNAQGLFVSSRI